MAIRIAWIVATAGILLAPLPGIAQRGGAGPTRGGPGARAELEARLMTRFATVVREQLELSAEEHSRVSTVLRESQEGRELIALRETQLRRRLLQQGRLALGAAPPLVSAEEAEALLSEMADLRNEEARLYASEREALGELLTPAQLVRFYALREALNERVQALRGPQAGQGRRGGARRPIS